MARLPGPADDWRATTKDEELQQELNFAASSPVAKGPMGTAQVTSPGLTHIGTTLSPPRVTFHTHPNGVDAPGLELEAARSLSALPELAAQVVRRPEVVTRPLKAPVLHRPIGLITLRGRSLSLAAQAMVALLRQEVEDAEAQSG